MSRFLLSHAACSSRPCRPHPHLGLFLHRQPTLEYLRHSQSRSFTNPPSRALVDAVRNYAAAERKISGTPRTEIDPSNLSPQAQKLGEIFYDDFRGKLAQDKNKSGPRCIMQTFKELSEIIKADKGRAKPYWSAQERTALEQWLLMEYNLRVKKDFSLDSRYLVGGVLALAGYGAWHLISGLV